MVYEVRESSPVEVHSIVGLLLVILLFYLLYCGLSTHNKHDDDDEAILKFLSLLLLSSLMYVTQAGMRLEQLTYAIYLCLIET